MLHVDIVPGKQGGSGKICRAGGLVSVPWPLSGPAPALSGFELHESPRFLEKIGEVKAHNLMRDASLNLFLHFK